MTHEPTEAEVEAARRIAEGRSPYDPKLIRDQLTAAYAARQDGGREADGWQPIESAPKDGTRVIVIEGRNIDIAHFEERCDDDIFFDDDEDGLWQTAVGEMLEPTAWRPLPPPPDTNQQDDAREREDG